MTGKKLKRACILPFIGAVAIALVAVPVSHYIDYNNRVNNGGPSSGTQTSTSTQPKRILQSIDAKLKDGVKFYANNLAKINNDDIIVTAHYLTGDVSSEETLESDKFTIETPADFELNGGKVIISYFGKTCDIDIKLIDVVAESIEIIKMPYKTNYQVGSKFDATGMEIKVIFNDGSSKTLDQSSYTYDNTKALAVSDKKVTISYKIGNKTLTVDVTINVVEKLEKGNIVSLDTDGMALVNVNENLSNTQVKVLGVYENGDRELLEKSQYQIVTNNEKAMFGKKHTITIKYNESVSKEIPVTVRHHTEGEDTTIVGGNVVNEDEYLFENNTFTKLDKIGSAGGFGQSVRDGLDAYIKFDIESYIDCTSDIILRCGNSYLVKENDNYYMRPLQINTIADLLINGKKIDIPDSVVLKGCGPYDKYPPLYGVYYEFTFEDISLAAGVNEIKLQFKNSTEGAVTTWNESPSTMNIDYINVDTIGGTISTTSKVKALAFAKNPQLSFGDKISDLNLSIIAINEKNEKFMLDKDQYTIAIDGNSEYLGLEKTKLIITYKADPTIKIEKEFNVNYLKLEAEDGELKGKNTVVSKTADEYIYDNGAYKSDGKVTAVYGMDNSATSGNETSITFKFNAVEGTYALKARLSNANYYMSGEMHCAYELVLKDVLKVKVNGNYVDMTDEKLPAISATTNGDYIYQQFFERILANISLVNGENTIVIEANVESSLRNHWNEIPVPRFDWFKISKM